VTHPVVDGCRLALGTLTVVPTRPPATVDRETGSWAMTVAPLVGVLLAVPVALLQWLLNPNGPALHGAVLVAALSIGLLTLLTRAIHLDGLADTVDGLGSGKPAGQALDVMRRSDIGPFGVAALVLVLLVQVSALAQHVAAGNGPGAVLLALVVSRLALPLVCSRGIRAARPDGLGRAVAGSVTPARLGVAAVLGAVAMVAFVAVVYGLSPFGDGGLILSAAAVAAAALLAGAALCLWCVRRLGGVTGDVLGACVEVTFTVALVVPAVL
jgi:adenosylcobinamide-GDP ribazoletransferase